MCDLVGRSSEYYNITTLNFKSLFMGKVKSFYLLMLMIFLIRDAFIAQSFKNEIGVTTQASLIYSNKIVKNETGGFASAKFSLKKQYEYGFSFQFLRESKYSNLFYVFSFSRNSQKYDGEFHHHYYPDQIEKVSYLSNINLVNWGLQKQFPITKRFQWTFESGILLRYYDQKQISIVRKERPIALQKDGDLYYDIQINRNENHGNLAFYANTQFKYKLIGSYFLSLGINWSSSEKINYTCLVSSIKYNVGAPKQMFTASSLDRILKTNQLNTFIGFSYKF